MSFSTASHCQSISKAVYTERKFKNGHCLFSNNLIGSCCAACIRSLSGLTRSQAWRIWHRNESLLSQPLEGPHAKVWVTGVGRPTLAVRVDPSCVCYCSPALEGQLSNGNWVCFNWRNQENATRWESLIRLELYLSFWLLHINDETVSPQRGPGRDFGGPAGPSRMHICSNVEAEMLMWNAEGSSSHPSLLRLWLQFGLDGWMLEMGFIPCFNYSYSYRSFIFLLLACKL